jgi:hypothetical protein
VTEVDALLVSPLYSFLRSRLRPCDPLRPSDPRFSPRRRFPSDSGTPRGTGTRPSLTAGGPTTPLDQARDPPCPPTPESADAHDRSRPEHASDTQGHRTATAPEDTTTTHASRSSVAPGYPRTSSDPGLGSRRDPKDPALTFPGRLADARTERSSRPLPHPKRTSAPESTPLRLAEAGRTASETSRPPDRVKLTHPPELQVSQPRRRTPVSLETGPHRLSTMSFLPRSWGSRADRDPPTLPDPRSVEVREQLRVSRRRSLAVLGFSTSSRPRDREAPLGPGL